ncbi:MAG TPA: thioredoxin-like domain-containing protein [Opitutaceae bacterium]|nr:thioredoxin-like domain-containing protein [Opitutaceae bacterium]
MKKLSPAIVWLGLALAVCPVNAETWSTIDGQKLDGKLSGVYGSLAVFSTESSSAILSLDTLDDTALARVGDYLDANPIATSQWKTSQSKVARSVRGRLQVQRGGSLVDFDPGERPEPVLYLAYFGAHWCPPCREFSPKLVEAYARLQKEFPNTFELIFVSNDRDAHEQADYARAVNMPWPMIRYSDLGGVRPIEQWAPAGIPTLAVLTRDGAMLFNSYHGDDYVGPYVVLQQFEELLRGLKNDSSETRRVRHRLSVVQYLRATGSGKSAPPKPYLIELDMSQYQTLTESHLAVILDLDAQGRVTHAEIKPRLPTVLNYQMINDAEHWLFLPKVENGHAVATKVTLPLKMDLPKKS